MPIRDNLTSFLNPGLPTTPTKPIDPSGALKLRMAQMELANRMKLSKSGPSKPRPTPTTPPSGKFGSAHGVFHLQKGDFGKPTHAVPHSPYKPSPYQQVFASASETKEDPPQSPPGDDQVVEIPKDAEVKANAPPPKQQKKRRFRNPTL